MIEIRQMPHSSDRDEYKLFIDGEVLPKVELRGGTDRSGKFTYEIYSFHPDSGLQLFGYAIPDFPSVDSLSLPWKSPALPFIKSFIIRADLETKTLGACYLSGEPDLSNWTFNFGFADYCREFEKCLAPLVQAGMIDTYKQYKGEGSYLNEFEMFLPISGYDLPIIFHLEKIERLLGPIHRQIVTELSTNSRPGSVQMTFDFPDQVKVPCEQYLVYFSQFLRDLGIEASSELTNLAGQVLFTVTPNDPHQALEQIRIALDVYLQLPTNPHSDSFDSEIAVQRLSANILHLRGQLTLARAEVQMLKATVTHQLATIHQQNLFAEHLLTCTQTPSAKSDEDLFGGMITLTKIQLQGVEINLGEIFRKLRQMVRKLSG